MHNARFIPPLNLDRDMFAHDSPMSSGKPFNTPDAKYFDDRYYASGSRLDFRGLIPTASSLSLVSHVDISPMSAPPRSSGAELSSLHSAGKNNRKDPRKIWKLFTRNYKVDKSRSTNPPFKSLTACDNLPVKKHKSTPDLKGLNFKDVSTDPLHSPCEELPPASAESFVRTSSQRIITDHPTIILIIDDNWDSSSSKFPLKRVDQIIPMDITDEESSECSSRPNALWHPQRVPQLHPIRGQRRRAETSKSSQEKWFKNYMHDPDASFLNLDEKTNTKRFRI